MATIITSEKLEKHSVSKYGFKSLGTPEKENTNTEFTSSLVSQQSPENIQETIPVDEKVTEETPLVEELQEEKDISVDASAMSKNSKDALIESLMKKTDEMSSNFIKLQMKLEAKEEEYTAGLAQVKEDSFNEGLEEGMKKAAQDSQSNLENGIEQFATSVTTLEAKAKEFETSLEDIKSDLITAALDIAKEVVSVEIKESASEIAKVLGDGLIKELQGASDITLKVNPKDHGPVSEHVKALDNVKIVSDSAVSEGGVIAISDSGNIDSQISKRFEKVKKAALSE